MAAEEVTYRRWLMAVGAVATIGAALSSPRAINAWNSSVPGVMHLARDGSLQVGASIVGGAVVSISVLFFERALVSTRNRQEMRIRLSLEATLDGADLARAPLAGAYLRHKSMKAARLDGADLRNAVLLSADLSGARLVGADLTGALIDGARIQRMIWDGRTKWPSIAFGRWLASQSEYDPDFLRFVVVRADTIPRGLGFPVDDPRHRSTLGANTSDNQTKAAGDR